MTEARSIYHTLADGLGSYDDWSEADRAALRGLQDAVWGAVSGMVDRSTADWITEEALWQVGATLRRHAMVRIPRTCELRIQHTHQGRQAVCTLLGAALDAREAA